MHEQRLLAQLEKGLTDMGQTLTAPQCRQLIDYLVLLDKWNKAYNLSAVREPGQMVSRHLLDSLSVRPQLEKRLDELQDGPHSRVVLDVGTGPGLPGIPLAICFPQHRFYLLDSNGKKTRFLFQMVLALQLSNVIVENTRIERYQCPDQVDIVVSRAFSSLNDFAAGCEHLCTATTRLLAMKGLYPDSEIAALPAHWQVTAAHALQVPGCEGERQLIELGLQPGTKNSCG